MLTARTFGWRLEAWVAGAALGVLRRLPITAASALGGRMARAIGPLLPVSRVANENLRRAMPELDAAARRAIIRGIWDNLGRTVAELPHLPSLGPTGSGPGWVLEGAEHVARIAAAGGPAIFVSAHLGNWEVLPRVAARAGVRLASFYRPATNKRVDVLLQRVRAERMDALPHFPKGATGARAALLHLRAGGGLAMLVDQKMNDGISAKLFGLPAMTAPAAAAYALRFGCPILPAFVERIGPARFRVICGAPLRHPDSGDRATDIAALTQAINDRLEAAIRRRPEQWLWLHRRWPPFSPTTLPPG